MGRIKNTITQLFMGLKSADNVIVNNGASDEFNGITINADVKKEKAGAVFQNLLQGEITQEVKELRYSNYRVAKEANNYKVFGSNAVKKRPISLDNNKKLDKYENSNEYDILLVQKNFPDNTQSDSIISVFENGFVENKSIIECNRDYFPKFKLEDFTSQIVVKYDNKEDSYYIDFYTSTYCNNDTFKNHSIFISEINKIKDNKIKKSDIIDFEKVSFKTFKATNEEDDVIYTFKIIKFIDIKTFDGSYVLHFKVELIEQEKNDLEQVFYDEQMEQKYQNKEKRDQDKVMPFIDVMSEIDNKKFNIEDGVNLLDKFKDKKK